MNGKSWYASKTLWVNAIAFIGLLLQSQVGFILDAEEQAAGLLIVNVVLRLITKDKINLKTGQKSQLIAYCFLIVFPFSFLTGGCASSIQSISGSYAQTSVAVKDFAKISANDWLFGSGIIQGALPESALPSWVFEEMRKVDSWFETEGDLCEHQLGYIVGLRIRLAGPLIRAAVEQYAPGILLISEVTAVLAFVGL